MILKSQFTRTSKCSSWCQNKSWGQTVRHYFKEFAMTSKSLSSRQKVCHRIKIFVMMSKNMPNVCHEIKNMSWCQKNWMYCLVTYIYTHTLTYNLICYILIKFYIVLQLYRINLRINYNIVIVCKILVQTGLKIYSITLLIDQTKCINIIN